jgi:hypothetical protein
MQGNSAMLSSSRRHFLQNILPVGATLCLGSRSLFAGTWSKDECQGTPEKHKILEDSAMTFTDVFQFAFRNYYIPCLKSIADALGHREFIELLKKVNSESVAQSARERSKSLPKNDFATYVELTKKRKDRFVRHVLTDEVVAERPDYIRTKITECLWAKVFRESDAANIGYAAICYPDFALASAFNPKITLVRPRTLMEGHECCDFHYRWEG